jgi:flavin reductase (DIM6/NTAB) family NADH-FMN oxidoreductase RutF
MSLDPESLRQAMRRWASGVTIVTAAHEGIQHGMTVSSFTSISLTPALILISLQQESRTHELVTLSGHFGVTILAESQQDLSERFAGRIAETEDRLAGLETETLVSGAPLLKGGLAYLDCRVVTTYPAGMNTLFIAEVLAASGHEEEAPLVYFNRTYRRIRL